MVSPESLDRAIAEERYRAAREMLDELDGWRADVRRAQLDQRDPKLPVDETLLTVEKLLADAAAVPEDLPLAHALRIRGYGMKRSFVLTERAVAEAREALGAHPRVLLAEGRAMMRFDERGRAHDCFEAAVAAGGEHADDARYALADALYVLGDFDAALTAAHAIGDGPTRVRALRLAASCHAARQDHEAEAEAYREVLEAGGQSDHAQNDRVSYALALASTGRRADALEELTRAWRDNPSSGPGRYAKERMRHLERHLEGGRHKRLHAFPTTAQKWNYCGPAVLELCFRYLELELTQEEIADTVKRETGTPMYEIVTFLRAHDIAARRIEATRERLMAAIDLDLPVIIQEEYSTTSHVAVITGYDEALGTFVAHDPATHRPMLKTFEFQRRSGDLYGNGAVIVLGRAGPDLEAREKACDERGLVDAPHLSMLDDADRLRPSSGGEREGATLQEVLRRCDEAIAIESKFKLAWHRRVHARHRLSYLTGRPHERERFLVDLHHVRVTFPHDEWPHQLHAHYLFDRNLLDEAYAEYLEASLRDPGDANNRENMGECMWLGGDLERAEKHLREALALSPIDVRAAENLCAVYARELLERRRKRGDFDSSLAPARVYERLRYDDTELRRRADFFSRVAIAGHPGNPFNHEVAGDLAAMREDWEGAVGAYQAALERSPGRSFALLGLARALRALDRLEEALGHLEKLTEGRAPTRGYTLHAEVLEGLGRGEDGAAVILDAIARGAEPKPLAQALFALYGRLGSREAAAAKLRELAEQQSANQRLLRVVGEVLDDERQLGHATTLFRQVVAQAPTDVDSVYRLGTLLTKDVLTRDEGERLLERVIELAPRFSWARVRLAWSLIDRDPGRGLALLAELPDQQDAYVLETRAALLERTEGADASAGALELALQTWGDPERGLVELVQWHLDDYRYERALALARQIPSRVQAERLRDRANRRWLSAHRLGGAMREALPRLEELCADGVPRALAWNAYWGLYTIDHARAAEAADQVAGYVKGEEVLTWRIRAAAQRAKAGDESKLTEVASEAEGSAEHLAQLSYAYVTLKRWDDANAAADRAMAIEDTNQEALGAMENAWVRRGDLAQAIACARRLTELHPYEHIGPERLGALLARQLEVEEALVCSLRAVDAAPFCHNAHWSRALALFANDELDAAVTHARRALALHEPDAEDAANGSLMIVYAADKKPDALEACLETQYAEQPRELFAAFDDKLRGVARR